MKSAPSGRQIFKRGSTGAVAALLQTVFVAEILRSSSYLWLVSPWISDFEVIDNRMGGFVHLDPSWPIGSIRLSDVLATLLSQGTKVHIATRPAPRWISAPDSEWSNDRFLNELRRRVDDDSILVVHREEEKHLHAKGLLGDHFFLSGSMNFTHNGVVVNEEHVRYTTDPAEVAEARLEFRERWGG